MLSAQDTNSSQVVLNGHRRLTRGCHPLPSTQGHAGPQNPARDPPNVDLNGSCYWIYTSNL